MLKALSELNQKLNDLDNSFEEKKDEYFLLASKLIDILDTIQIVVNHPLYKEIAFANSEIVVVCLQVIKSTKNLRITLKV